MFEVGDPAQAGVYWVRFLFEKGKEKRLKIVSQKSEVVVESEKHP